MILSKHQALLEGSKLWVIPEDKYSPWNLRINWLINFQLSKTKLHAHAELSAWIKNCIEETGIEIPQVTSSETILIPIKKQLPADWLCQIPINNRLNAWVENIYKVWSQLQRPKMRVFLPLGADHEDWQKYWVQFEPNEELTVVMQNEKLT